MIINDDKEKFVSDEKKNTWALKKYPLLYQVLIGGGIIFTIMSILSIIAFSFAFFIGNHEQKIYYLIASASILLSEYLEALFFGLMYKNMFALESDEEKIDKKYQKNFHIYFWIPIVNGIIIPILILKKAYLLDHTKINSGWNEDEHDDFIFYYKKRVRTYLVTDFITIIFTILCFLILCSCAFMPENSKQMDFVQQIFAPATLILLITSIVYKYVNINIFSIKRKNCKGKFLLAMAVIFAIIPIVNSLAWLILLQVKNKQIRITSD